MQAQVQGSLWAACMSSACPSKSQLTGIIPQPFEGIGFTPEPVKDRGMTPPEHPRGGAPHLRAILELGTNPRELSTGLDAKVCYICVWTDSHESLITLGSVVIRSAA